MMKDYTGQGIREAEVKHGGYSGHPGNSELMRQYWEGRDTPAPYTPPLHVERVEQDSDALSIQTSVKIAVRVSAIGLPVAGCAGLYTVLVSGALNTVLGWLIGGLGGVFIFANMVSAVGGKSEGRAGGGASSGGGASQTINININQAGAGVNIEKK